MSFSLKTLLMLVMVLVMSSLQLACGDSEVYFAMDGASGSPTLPGQGGKGDMAQPSPEEIASPEFKLSGQIVRFEGEGREAMIALEPAQISESFGQGAALVRHSEELSGLVISWDGQPTEVFVRSRSDRYTGQWTQATVMAAQDDSYRVSYESPVPAMSLDVFIADPRGITFMFIEPLFPNE